MGSTMKSEVENNLFTIIVFGLPSEKIKSILLEAHGIYSSNHITYTQ